VRPTAPADMPLGALWKRQFPYRGGDKDEYLAIRGISAAMAVRG
jgi:hypothetical protein